MFFDNVPLFNLLGFNGTNPGVLMWVEIDHETEWVGEPPQQQE